MRSIAALLTSLLILGVGSLTLSPGGQTNANGPLASGEIIVKFKAGVSDMTRAITHSQLGGRPKKVIRSTDVELVSVPHGQETALAAAYGRNPNVLFAEPNFIRTIPTPTSLLAGSEVLPGDFYFDEQWGLNNTGQQFYCIPYLGGELCFYVGTYDADMDAPEAWAISTGSSAVKIAILDSGIDYNHPDLAPNYAHGYDFVN